MDSARSLRLLTLATLIGLMAGLMGSVPTVGAQELAAGGLAGLWRGPVTQSDPAQTYEVDITLFPGPAGTLATGRADYPALACGGTLEMVAQSPGIVVSREVLTYGWDACIDQGHLTLRARPDGRLDFLWREHPDAPPLATGVLVRLDQLSAGRPAEPTGH